MPVRVTILTNDSRNKGKQSLVLDVLCVGLVDYIECVAGGKIMSVIQSISGPLL
jgi:hypothetical protein